MFGKSTFGSTGSTFGSTGSSLFGQNKPTTNLFGQQSTTTQGSLFGQKTTTNLFSQSTAPTGSSIFGSAQTSNTGTSLFGQTKPSLFGSSTTTGTSLFGSTASSTGTGLFGSSTSAVNGTTIKFEPLVSSDTMMKNGSQTTIQTKHMCITAMKAYESKSLEELRIDDYIANRKTPSATGGLFGSSTNTGSSLFSSTPAKSSLFGSSTTTSSPFGSATQGTSLFGQNNNTSQGTSLFGNKPAGSIFGSPATSSSTFGSAGGSLFGNTAGSTFGSNQTQQTGSLFGGSTFGSTATTTSPFTFGSTTNTTSTPFGQTATSTSGGLFGSSSTATTGGLFGKPAGTSAFSFGGSSNTSFGQNTSGGLFGSTQKQGGLFGSNTSATGGSLFGSQPAQQGTGLFGSTQPTQTTLFGSNTANQQGTATATGFGSAVPTTISVPAAAPIVLGSDVNQAQVQMALLDAQIAASPYGDSPLLKLASIKDFDDMPNPVSTQRQLKFLAAKSATSSPLNLSQTNGDSGSSSFHGSQISMRSSFLPVIPPKVADTCKASPRIRSPAIPGRDINYTSNVAPPTLGKGIRTKAMNGINSLTNRSLNGSLINKTVDTAIETSLSCGVNKPPNHGRQGNLKHLDMSVVMQALSHRSNSEVEELPKSHDPDELPSCDKRNIERNEVYSPEIDQRAVVIQRGEVRNGEVPRFRLDGSACEDSHISLNRSSEAQTATTGSSSVSCEAVATPQVVASSTTQPIVRLNSPDYFTKPTINAMRGMIVNGKVVLNNGLTVGRATYGSVFWPGRIELENIVLDEVVIFRHKEVTVYPDESLKPPLGEGLNRPAEITLERVWYIDRTTKEEIRDSLKLIDLGWRDRLEKVTARMGATFKDYRPATGSWVFRVEHFSKYGLPDEEDDVDVAIVPNGKDVRMTPADISCDVDTSMEEQRLQSYVQRAKVVQVDARNGMNTTNRMQIAINSDVEFANQCIPRMKEGLGGKLDTDYDDDDSALDYDMATWRDTEVPYKKPKTEEMLDYVFEESKRLMEQSTLAVRPIRRITLKCHDPVNVFRGGIEESKGIGYKKSSIMDIACARGQSSRVSWSHAGQFAFSMQPSSNQVQICVLNFDSSLPEQVMVDMLEHNVRLSRVVHQNTSTIARVKHCEIEGQISAPRVKPSEDIAPQLLDSFLATAVQSECSSEQRVWRLCQALFPTEKSGNWQWRRTRRVGEWFCEEVSRLPKGDIPKETVSHVWYLMCAGEATAAIRLANEGGMAMLSLMISTVLSLEHIGRYECSKMVEMWEMNKDINGMSDDLIKIFLVLAGRTHGKFVRNEKAVSLNCLESLDWRQAFGIHLWFVNCGGLLEDAIESFTEDVKAGRASSPECHLIDQLIRLACYPSHQVEAVLDAATMLNPNPLDTHLTWHLWSLLRAIGYNTMSLESEQRLHVAYSSLLTAYEKWHLAIFVLSHICHDQCRSLEIRHVLDRMSLTARPQHYDRVLSICQIPAQWIFAAKLMKAKLEGKHELACQYALAAGEYDVALRLFADEVAPNAIAMGDLEKLRPLAEKMEKEADKIKGWGAIGQIYADYCMLKTMDDEDTEDNEEKLQQLVDSLRTRIRAPVFDKPIQRLCVKTMARELFEIQRLTGEKDFSFPLSRSQIERLIF